MNEPLLVDALNTAEVHAFYLRRAVAFYRDRLAEGCEVNGAAAQACAYLRRKTGWAAPIALGAFDSALRDAP